LSAVKYTVVLAVTGVCNGAFHSENATSVVDLLNASI